MRLEHHLVGGYVRYISPYIIIIIYYIYKYSKIWFSLTCHHILLFISPSWPFK